jgi:hypothetical protein
MHDDGRTYYHSPINRTDAYKARKENRERRLANRRRNK